MNIMNIMKIVAYILNVILFIGAIVLLSEEGISILFASPEFAWFFCPIVNCLVLFFGTDNKSNSWLMLYIKRKKLEEQQKIEALKNKEKYEGTEE